ncbi:hypothetical protein WA026_004856 [Henosepilachna vigintioctopunctata]|uniref:protein-tyrosine-phosphatase n=1 Tax=Henosepilachna vigintioctopunctata TaxID=420089 RepID=A0AAW1UM93_9CUCU
MQELTASTDSPIVVHCSGGVGRTGIILLCVISVTMAQEKGVVDMAYTLNKLREKRPNMVDNYEQYKLAHLVVLDCLNTLSTEIKCDDRFKHFVNRLLQNKEDKLEFIYLKENQWRDEAMKSVASDTRNYTNYPEKNRIQSLVPGNQERVCLSKLPNQDESSTYINAVWVHGYRSPEKFIVTQQPLPNTLSEFWRLIVEKDIRVVVSLNKINLLNEDSWIFWPNEDQPQINPVDFLSVIFEKVVQSTYFDVYSVKILENGKKKLHVKIYSFKHWESGIHIPPSCEGFLSLLDTVESISHESRHILVTCWDGFIASGIYVALSYIIQRMKMEEVCDVCLSVRRIRHSREEFIANDVQYSFLYSAALCWMEKNT